MCANSKKKFVKLPNPRRLLMNDDDDDALWLHFRTVTQRMNQTFVIFDFFFLLLQMEIEKTYFKRIKKNKINNFSSLHAISRKKPVC